MISPEVTLELLSLASRSNLHVYLYPACVVNRVRFLTRDHDNQQKTQNTDVFVPGMGDETFYD